MVDQFARFIQQQKLCNESDSVLLAVSGGVDSMVMLDLFMKNGYSVGLAHCNFGLRGEESDGDEDFVKTLAHKKNIPVFLERFETEKFSKGQGVSIQMAARELRYHWFEQIRQSEGYDYIATGHNLNDSIETIIFNLIKGTGLKGLTGIQVKAGNLIRPLLFAKRENIESYAADHKLGYRIDSSNASTKYHRNYIRHKILPEYEKINPGFLDTMQNTIARLGGIQKVMDYWLEAGKSEYYEERGGDIYLKKKFFIDAGEPALLYEVIGRYGFNYDQCVGIFENLKDKAGGLFHSNTYILNNDRMHLIISRNEVSEKGYEIARNDKLLVTNRFNLKMEYIDAKKETINPSTHIAYLDVDKLEFPLELRAWKDGDWFMPLGMKGKKKLSDFMIDKKIPLNLKKRIMVLLSGGSIVWIAGYRIDDRFKKQGDTKKLLKITYLALDD